MIKETLPELKIILSDLEKTKKSILKELAEVEQDIFLTKNVIRMKKGLAPLIEVGDTELENNEIPEEYSNDLFQDQKVIYTVHTLKEASVKQIAEYMHKMEHGSVYDSVYKRAQQVVMRLTKENKLIKIGKYASKYKINRIE